MLCKNKKESELLSHTKIGSSNLRFKKLPMACCVLGDTFHPVDILQFCSFQECGHTSSLPLLQYHL